MNFGLSSLSRIWSIFNVLSPLDINSSLMLYSLWHYYYYSLKKLPPIGIDWLIFKLFNGDSLSSLVEFCCWYFVGVWSPWKLFWLLNENLLSIISYGWGFSSILISLRSFVLLKLPSWGPLNLACSSNVSRWLSSIFLCCNSQHWLLDIVMQHV